MTLRASKLTGSGPWPGDLIFALMKADESSKAGWSLPHTGYGRYRVYAADA